MEVREDEVKEEEEPPIPTEEELAYYSSLPRRNLQQTVMNLSRNCKISCIDAGKNFCPYIDHKGSGTCCNMDDSKCPRVTGDVCSKDLTLGSNGGQRYFACGNLCSNTASYKIQPAFGVSNVVTLTQNINVAQDSVCGWKLILPPSAYINDVITFRVNKADNAVVYYFISNSFSDAAGTTYQSGVAGKGSKFSATYP